MEDTNLYTVRLRAMLVIYIFLFKWPLKPARPREAQRFEPPPLHVGCPAEPCAGCWSPAQALPCRDDAARPTNPPGTPPLPRLPERFALHVLVRDAVVHQGLVPHRVAGVAQGLRPQLV